MNLAIPRSEMHYPIVRAGPKRSALAFRIGVYMLLAGLDILSILVGFLVADLAYHGTLTPTSDSMQALIVAVIYGGVGLYGGAFSHDGLMQRRIGVGRAAAVLLATLGGVLLVAFLAKESAELSRLIFFAGSALSLALLSLERFLVISWVKARHIDRVMTNVLVRDELDVSVPGNFEVIDARAMRIEPNINDPMMLHLLGLLLAGADRVVVACPPERRRQWAAMLKGSNLNGEVLVPEIDELRPVKTRGFSGVSTITVSAGPLDLRNRILKRTLDLVLTVPILIFLAPLLALTALAIRIDSPGPLLFVQTRMGRGNRLFRMFKFRSMRTDLCDVDGNRSASRDDDRVTRVGRFIRATSIDELRPVKTRGFSGVSTITVSAGPLDLRNRILKRTLDLVLTVPILIFLAPLLALTALAIRLDSHGPLLFVQTRMGRGNRLFRMFKFRSMRTDLCDMDGNRSASRDDDRVTRVGRFIRATSIDELPQLFNVLLGDMSLVGPRPHALGSLAGDTLFWEVDSRYWHRHASKPGITGLAQIRGFRGATNVREDLTNRLQADLEYLVGWSLWRDIAILLGTLRVLVHKNAF